MDRTKCKLCSRTFANGRALGGHMKAHLATLPLPLPPPANPFSSDDEDDDAEEVYRRLRENPRRSLLKFSDPDGDSESETESDSARRPSKRGRSRKQISLATGEDEEEEEAAIAMCLVMLSRDKWRNTAVAVSGKNTDVMKRHRCEVCNKSFRSSQALGGHRVTHRIRKGMNVKAVEAEAEEDVAAAEKYRFAAVEKKIFECPFCYKVFSSGQALGGHKRSHANGSGYVPTGDPTCSHKQKHSSLIDLNLPAQPDEEDDCSVVSDGEITDPPGRI